MTQKQAWYDNNQSEFWTDWVRDVFDIRTANAFGLQVWSIILGIPLVINTSPSSDGDRFGFGDAGDDFNPNFTRGTFGQSTGGSVNLTVEQQRIVLRLRYFQLVGRNTVPEINKFMKMLFASQGLVYVVDNYDMTMSYVFGFAIDSGLAFILQQYDLLPRPSTVGIDYAVYSTPVFGFGSFNLNFTRGSFYNNLF
jgi:hypothetical protein